MRKKYERASKNMNLYKYNFIMILINGYEMNISDFGLSTAQTFFSWWSELPEYQNNIGNIRENIAKVQDKR